MLDWSAYNKQTSLFLTLCLLKQATTACQKFKNDLMLTLHSQLEYACDKQAKSRIVWVLQYIVIGFASVFLLPTVDFEFQMDITKTKTKSMN